LAAVVAAAAEIQQPLQRLSLAVVVAVELRV
jgi:hypothetical protein